MFRQRKGNQTRAPRIGDTVGHAGTGALVVASLLLALLGPGFDSGEVHAADDESNSGIDPTSIVSTTIPDTLRIHCRDGRRDIQFPVHKVPEGAYVGLGDLGQLTGRGFVWDPELFRGSFEVDSTRIGFVLDSPLFWVAGEVFQADGDVLYRDEEVLLPYSVLESICIPAFAERAQLDSESGVLQLGGPVPWIEKMEMERAGRRVRLTISPNPGGDRRVRWDPSGMLAVDLHGLSLAPNHKTPTFDVRGVERVETTPTASGVEVRLWLDPGWVGVRSRDGDDGVIVELTQSMQDVQQGRFELVTSYLRTGGSDRSRALKVLVEVSPPGSSNSSGSRYLRELSSELTRVLEDDFRHQVIIVPDRKHAGRRRGRHGLPELPGVVDADCWIGLRLESYGSADARDFLLVTPGHAARLETLGAPLLTAGAPVAAPGGEQVIAPPEVGGKEADQGVRMVPWGQAPRLHARGSRQLARNVADHIESELRFRPIRRIERPARIFRGLSMPALLIYPAVEADVTGLRALASRDQVELVAKSLAFGIDEFLRSQASGR